MGTRSGAWGIALAAAVAIALSTLTRGPANAAEPPDRSAAAELLLLVNGERAQAGLAPLAPSSAATEVAEAWSSLMADTGDLAHNDAWFGADSRRRVGAGAMGENVATNSSIADAHRRLMLSPGHRANILDSRFNHVGIGVVRGPSGAFWITQDFFELRSAPDIFAPAPEPSPPPPPTTIAPEVDLPRAAPEPPPAPSTTMAAPPAPAPAPQSVPAPDPTTTTSTIHEPAVATELASPALPTPTAPLRPRPAHGVPFVLVAVATFAIARNVRAIQIRRR